MRNTTDTQSANDEILEKMKGELNAMTRQVHKRVQKIFCEQKKSFKPDVNMK